MILVEEQQLNYLTHSWGDKDVHTFPKGISPKVNAIMCLDFKLSYFEVPVLHFSHFTIGTSPRSIYEKENP